MAQTYLWPLPDSLRPNHLIRIRGCIQKDGKRFDINLQSDFEYTKSDLVLHVSMRYSDGQGFIVINSKNENGWMEEQMHRNICFEPGVDFELLILSDFDKFQIALNGNHICNYSHRLPYSIVKCLGVKGEAQLNLISLEDDDNPEIDVSAPQYRNPLSVELVPLPKKKLKKVIRCRVS